MHAQQHDNRRAGNCQVRVQMVSLHPQRMAHWPSNKHRQAQRCEWCMEQPHGSTGQVKYVAKRKRVPAWIRAQQRCQVSARG